jgi:ribonuclease HI
MYFEGSLMKSRARAGLIFVSSLGVCMRYMIQIHFLTSNNVIEYETLVNILHIATELRIRWLDVQGDSQLIIDQVMKESSCHDPEWQHTTRRFASWKKSLMASILTTLLDGRTRQHHAMPCTLVEYTF